MGRVITNMDAFSSPIPQLNIDGETEVRTLCGGIISFLIFMAALAYAASNALELVNPKSPVIISDKKVRWFGNNEADSLKLADANFKLAFTLRDS